MAKIPFQDVVPPDKRSIRNIPISNSRKNRPPLLRVPTSKPETQDVRPKRTEAPQPEQSFDQESETFENINQVPQNDYFYYDKKPPQKQASGKRGRTLIGGSIFLVVIAFIVIMMTVFASAKVVVTPKRQALSLNKDVPVSTQIATSSAVGYEVIKLSKTKSVVVDAKGEEMVERKATGKIVVYNNFSTEPQRLITRTRFESEAGLIYRIPESIIVPGMKKNADGSTVPGSIEVSVTADEAGEKYNVDNTNFTVPGFKSDAARYKAFTAKTSGSISGGLVGKVKTVDATQKQTALQKIDADLSDELKRDLMAQIPSGLIVLDGSIVYDFKELPQKDDSSSATLSKEGTAYVVAIKRDDLSKKIIADEIAKNPEWQSINAQVENFDTLRISNKLSLTDIAASKPLTLKIEGSAVAVATINSQNVASKLAGIRRTSISEAMKAEPGIIGVKASIRPIWKRAFPSNPSKIYVEVEPQK